MSKPPALTVTVDRDRCQGHNRCHAIAAELFELDDEGHAAATGDGVVPPHLARKARLAARNCPERAVLLHEPDAETA